MKNLMKMVMFSVLLMAISLTSGCGYNVMQGKEEEVFAKWANVEATYQRRADLLPNLCETVKAYATHEKDTLIMVSQARASVGSMKVDASQLSSAEKMRQFQAHQQTIGTALSRLMMVSEKYPQLKADEQFKNLQAELAGTENRINHERVKYNRSVQEFNTMIRQMPYSLTNSMILHLEKKTPFKADDASKNAPKLSFGK